MVSNIYPDYEFLPWKFANPPKNYSTNPEVARRALAFLEEELNIRISEDWYRVSKSLLKEFNLDGVFSDTKAVLQALDHERPDLKLDPSKFL